MIDHSKEQTLPDQSNLKALQEINHQMCLTLLLNLRMKNIARLRIQACLMVEDLEACFHFNTIISRMEQMNFTSTKDIILILLKTILHKVMIK